MQRLMFTNFSLFWGFPVSRLCLMFMPMIALLWGVTLAETSVPDALSYCVPALLGSLITGQYMHGRFRWPFITHLYEVIQSVHLASNEIRFLGNIRATKFSVTPKTEILEKDFVSALAKPFYILLGLCIAALAVGRVRIINEAEHRDMLLFVGFWTLTDFVFLLCELGVTLERRQRRTEPRPRVDAIAQLQIASNHTQPCSLVNASASGAGIITNNHSDIWLALIHNRSAILSMNEELDFDVRVKKVTQLDDGRLAVGLSYARNSTASERAAVALAFGSAVQLQRNLLRHQHRKNVVGMSLMLLRKALVLGFRHLVLLIKVDRRLRKFDDSRPRLLWEKAHENPPTPALIDTDYGSRDELAGADIRAR